MKDVLLLSHVVITNFINSMFFIYTTSHARGNVTNDLSPLKMAILSVRMTVAKGSGDNDDDDDCHSIQIMAMMPDIIKIKMSPS